MFVNNGAVFSFTFGLVLCDLIYVNHNLRKPRKDLTIELPVLLHQWRLFCSTERNGHRFLYKTSTLL